jgi:hypothetical protein
MLKPLTWLDYRSAIAFWKIAMVLALVTFVLLQPIVSRGLALIAVCWSIPVADTFFNGQDSPLLLVWMALSLRLFARGKPLHAGLALSLAAAKFHFLILLPILLILQKQWRFLSGVSIGGAGLVLLSFITQGPEWPAQYYRVLRMPEIMEFPMVAPTLAGVLTSYDGSTATLVLFVAAIVIAVGAICVFGSFELGFAACLIGAVLVSPHAYLHDLTLMIAPLLIVAAQAKDARPIALFLLTPIPAVVLPLVLKVRGNVVYVALTSLLLTLIALRCSPIWGRFAFQPIRTAGGTNTSVHDEVL